MASALLERSNGSVQRREMAPYTNIGNVPGKNDSDENDCLGR